MAMSCRCDWIGVVPSCCYCCCCCDGCVVIWAITVQRLVHFLVNRVFCIDLYLWIIAEHRQHYYYGRRIKPREHTRMVMQIMANKPRICVNFIANHINTAHSTTIKASNVWLVFSLKIYMYISLQCVFYGQNPYTRKIRSTADIQSYINFAKLYCETFRACASRTLWCFRVYISFSLVYKWKHCGDHLAIQCGTASQTLLVCCGQTPFHHPHSALVLIMTSDYASFFCGLHRYLRSAEANSNKCNLQIFEMFSILSMRQLF